MCTVSPEARHGTESVSTLKFAQRASKIITKAERGLVYDGGLIPKYEERIASLQAELARVLSSNTSNDLLESEKRARKEAEDKAEEHRLATIQLNDQIEHLKKQLLTGTAEASDSAGGLPRTPSMAKRHYGDVGTGSRPAGHRSSHRRLSELAFGIASPARNSGLPASSSMRSISSALETITNSSIPQDSDTVRRLEEELKVSREELQQEKEVAREEIENLQKQIADLQSSEVFSKAQVE